MFCLPIFLIALLPRPQRYQKNILRETLRYLAWIILENKRFLAGY